MMLIMTIAGEPFGEIEFDFSGKHTPEKRQTYLEDVAAVLEEEYAAEISGQPVKFHYQRMSLMEHMNISEKEMELFEVKIQVRKFLKSKTIL